MWQSKADIKNPNWKYKPSFDTDIRKTLARVAKEMQAAKKSPRKAGKTSVSPKETTA